MNIPQGPSPPPSSIPVSSSCQEAPHQYQAALAVSQQAKLHAPELRVFMQSWLARGPCELYLSNVCAAGHEFREKGLLEDNTQKGEEKSK